MANVLADLCLESEAATVTAMRLARAFDEGGPFRRLATAVAKYWVCKATPLLVAEALECLGGNGYVEESGLPRLYRESPLNSIWEGSGQRDRARRAAGDRPRARVARRVPRRTRAEPRKHAEAALADADEPGARRLVEALATALQASLLVRHSPSEVADAFVATRLRGDRGRAYGTLPRGLAVDAIVDRHRPRL